uniref:Phlebovirus glycoprotein G2 fusion domain-containing protein n=1 Tax=viral metagenome TaxID=1070528 RepID=A0A6C0JT69_9ZZZZ
MIYPSSSFVLVFILLMKFSLGCVEIGFIHGDKFSCVKDIKGKEKCTVEDVYEIEVDSIGGENKEYCFSIIKNDSIVGKLMIQVNRITSKCNIDKDVYYTRSFVPKIISKHQCPGELYCKDIRLGNGLDWGEWRNLCEYPDDNKTASLFSDEANNSPGYTMCIPSYKAFRCTFKTDTCLFYRKYALSTSDSVFKVFGCHGFKSTVDFNLIIELGNETIKYKNLELYIGQRIITDHFSISHQHTTGSDLTLNTKFVSINGIRAIKIDANSKGILSPENVGAVQCSSVKEASEFKHCKLSRSMCSNCKKDFKNAMSCSLCNEHILETYFNSDKLLPISMGGYTLKYNHGQVELDHREIKSIMRIIPFNLKLSSHSYNNLCYIKEYKVSGCFRCNMGAILSYTCKTNFGEAIATITCGDKEFQTFCNENGFSTKRKLYYDEETFNHECFTNCPYGETNFTMNFTLKLINESLDIKYVPSINEIKYSNESVFWNDLKNGFSTLEKEYLSPYFKWILKGGFLSNILGNDGFLSIVTTISTILLVLVIIVLLFYCICKLKIYNICVCDTKPPEARVQSSFDLFSKSIRNSLIQTEKDEKKSSV